MAKGLVKFLAGSYHDLDLTWILLINKGLWYRELVHCTCTPDDCPRQNVYARVLLFMFVYIFTVPI